VQSVHLSFAPLAINVTNMHGPTWTHSHVTQYHQHMIKKLHLIKETSPSVKETRNDGSSMDDIIPYLHHRSAVRFSSPHDQKCCALLILLIEVLHTSSYHSLSAYRIRSCCWINPYPLSLMDIRDTTRPQPSY
jgi:hypothetical protein